MLILDTNVVSELRRPRKANPNVVAWAAPKPANAFFISAITVMELQLAALLKERKDQKQGKMFRAWIDDDVLPRFEGRILPIDTAVALRAAALHVPNPRPERDALIAATALVHAMTVVTRNAADFDMDGVDVLNPWD